MIDDFLDVLNRLLKIDPDGVNKMVEQGRINSPNMMNAKDDLGKGIVFLVDKAYSYISMLGVINSVLKKEASDNLICAVYDENGVIVRFGKWVDERPKPQIDKEYTEVSVDVG